MSQGERILNHLRLAPRILELRESGYRIDMRMVRLASGKRVGSYRMK